MSISVISKPGTDYGPSGVSNAFRNKADILESAMVRSTGLAISLR